MLNGQLKEQRAEDCLVETYIVDGQRKFHGNHNLKASQAYPPQFGYACSRVYERYKKDLLQSYIMSLRCWTDAPASLDTRWQEPKT